MSSRAVSALTIVGVSVASWYCGLKFWKPIIVAKLKEEGNLRDDIDIPEDDNNIPTSIQDIKTQIKIALHPELKDKYVQEQELKNTTEFEKLRDQIDGTAKD
ncbi:hypothetical protein DFJ63DRAFT_334968 [Scheffersomyces coipomensis]|uniref:uncharacterized protein n=1 Tax=Scheffersomyces coipomensis TaxID=1788519 RepID=UPI00315CCE62